MVSHCGNNQGCVVENGQQITLEGDNTLINIMNRIIRYTALLFVFLGLLSCSSIRSSDQFTNKVVAPQFVSELYGSASRTISVNHPNGGHISWLGFVQSNDYKYFKVTKVRVGTKTIISDGQELDTGDVFTANSNAIIEDIDIGSTDAGSTDFVNGNITVAGQNDLHITVEYSPLKAVDTDAEPHEAFLIINYDAPESGSMRVALEGFTKGIKSEKCTQDPSTMELIEYKVTGSAFDLFFCSSEVAKVNQNNTPQDSSDPGYHGTSTNVASIELDNDVLSFYKVDDETVCLLTNPTPTVEEFTLPIPPGLAPIDSMQISMVDGSFAECSLDADGNILCDQNVLIDALVSLSGFTLTNQALTAEELVSGECPDFGPISGAGAFGDDEMTLVFTGRTLSDMNTQEYNIVDSLIVAEIKLEK